MFWAILTAILFAFSAVFSQRTAQMFGSLPANFYRLVLACATLGVIVWSMHPATVRPDLFWKYFLSGIVGFGIGDVGLFLAYTRLGSRLTLLINYSCAAVFAAAGDFILLGKGMVWQETAGIALILLGLYAALYQRGIAARPAGFVVGVGCAVIAGFGQGFGTSLSTWANDSAASLTVQIPAMSQAFQRSSGGVLVAGLALAFLLGSTRMLARGTAAQAAPARRRKRKLWPFWLAGTALFGPILGVSCYQKALLEINNSAIVVSVAATCTLLVIPLARWLERDVPSRRQIIGSVLALAGVVWLCFVREQKFTSPIASPAPAPSPAAVR